MKVRALLNLLESGEYWAQEEHGYVLFDEESNEIGSIAEQNGDWFAYLPGSEMPIGKFKSPQAASQAVEDELGVETDGLEDESFLGDDPNATVEVGEMSSQAQDALHSAGIPPEAYEMSDTGLQIKDLKHKDNIVSALAKAGIAAVVDPQNRVEFKNGVK